MSTSIEKIIHLKTSRTFSIEKEDRVFWQFTDGNGTVLYLVKQDIYENIGRLEGIYQIIWKN